MTIYGNFPIIPLYNLMEKNWKATTLCIILWKKLESHNPLYNFIEKIGK